MSFAKILLPVLCMLWLTACSHQRTTHVGKNSYPRVKRHLNADGTYRVKSGDTLFAIAFSYGLDSRDVARWNGISSPYIIYPGQNLRLSPPAVTRQSHIPRQSTTKSKTSRTQPSSSIKKAPAKASAVQSADPKRWKWPAKGRLLRGYVAGDPARNGLDIAGREGSAITASAAGTVVYSGNGLIGYGELIIIKHSEKMLSAYAHNKVRLVVEGRQVAVGQKIAEMGRNDRNEQLLHFEIRVRGKPVNPLSYLPKK